jgi:hypothetical protein
MMTTKQIAKVLRLCAIAEWSKAREDCVAPPFRGRAQFAIGRLPLFVTVAKILRHSQLKEQRP